MGAPLSFGRQNPGAQFPMLPTGFVIAAYPNYAGAAGAIAHLVKNDFPVADAAIVGSDLRLVERVTGKLSASKLAGAGAASGAWMGVFVGLLMTLFQETPNPVALMLIAAGIGAIFGAVLGVLGFFMTKNRRDFTSASQIVAQRYDIVCESRTAERARHLLAQLQLSIPHP